MHQTKAGGKGRAVITRRPNQADWRAVRHNTGIGRQKSGPTRDGPWISATQAAVVLHRICDDARGSPSPTHRISLVIADGLPPLAIR